MSLNSVDFENLLGSKEQMASEISDLWVSWRSASSQHRDSVAEVLQYLYATDTKTTSNNANGHLHSTNIPKITQISDNLKANYASGLLPKPKFFMLEGEDTAAVTKETRSRIESYLVTKHRQNGFRSTILSLIDDWTDQGNCFAGVTYRNEKHTDPTTGEVIQGYRGPMPYRIDPNDITFNPMSSSFKESPKIIRSVKTLGSLAIAIEDDPSQAYLVDAFEKVKKVRMVALGLSDEEMDKTEQMGLDGFGTFRDYVKSGYVEVLDFYGDIYDLHTDTLLKNHVITVVDRRWVIRKQPVETWQGKPMIFHAGWRTRINNIYAMGPLENLIGMQYKINHLENARADAFDMMLNPDRVIRGDIEEVETDQTGARTYYVASDGDVRNLAPDTTVLNADFQIRETEEKMELYAGSPREAAGVRTPGEKTKFEFAELSNARGRIFQHKMTSFEVGILEDMLNAEIEVAKINVPTSGDIIRLDNEDDGSKVFQTIKKEDLTANGTIKAIGARHFAKQAQVAQNLRSFQQMLQADPEVANHVPSVRLAKMWQELMEFDDTELVQPYIRIAERLQSERLAAAANQEFNNELAAGVSEEEDIGRIIEEGES